MAKAQNGDHSAYRELLRELQMYVSRSLKTKFSNPQDLEDYVQEVLCAIHRARATYSPQRPFEAWLHAIMRYKFSDYLREHSKLSRFILDSDVIAKTASIAEASSSQFSNETEQLLKKLKPKHALVFRLVRIEGQSVKEVAEKLKMSQVSVKVTAHRASKELKKILEREAFEF